MKISVDSEGITRGERKIEPSEEDVRHVNELCLLVKRLIGKFVDRVEVITVAFCEEYPSSSRITPHFKVVILGPVTEQKLEFRIRLVRWQNFPHLQPLEYLAEEFMRVTAAKIWGEILRRKDSLEEFSVLVQSVQDKNFKECGGFHPNCFKWLRPA